MTAPLPPIRSTPGLDQLAIWAARLGGERCPHPLHTQLDSLPGGDHVGHCSFSSSLARIVFCLMTHKKTMEDLRKPHHNVSPITRTVPCKPSWGRVGCTLYMRKKGIPTGLEMCVGGVMALGNHHSLIPHTQTCGEPPGSWYQTSSCCNLGATKDNFPPPPVTIQAARPCQGARYKRKVMVLS